jgi:hypothetical protein
MYEQLNVLLDIVNDLGLPRKAVTWGRTPGPVRPAYWVAVTLPHGRREEHQGVSLDSASFALLHYCWPDPSDQPCEPT